MLSWKKLYDITLLETRPAERKILVAETERAILLRMREMPYEFDTASERLEIDNASSNLRTISKEIMAWENYEAH